MKLIKYLVITAVTTFMLSSCNDYLDKTDPTKAWDDNFWKKESEVDLYANTFYPYFFSAYNKGYGTAYAPLNGYTFSDDIVNYGTATQFSLRVPTGSIGSTSESTNAWQSLYAGPEWNFAWIRKANVMQDRIIDRMGSILSPSSFNHWVGIARFFKGMEYARLVNVFGDIPYYAHEVNNTDYAQLYKDRTPRNEVMDSVYVNFEYALNNVMTNAGALKVDKNVVASYVARYALYEGSWQKYHYSNTERAAKFFELAVDAAEIVMASGKYDIVTEFRSLFTQQDLAGNKDVIMYRKYDSDLSVTHSVASYCNMSEPRTVNINLDAVRSFICNDGKTFQNSAEPNAEDFNISSLIKSRDPRFEATFYHLATSNSKSSYLYSTKFIPRSALDYINSNSTPGTQWQGDKNTNSYPTMRYAEVLLSWIEAKAELADLGQGSAVTQNDLDISINKLRNRPLAPEAVEMGVKQTAPLQIASLPNDAYRDPSVPSLLWEIRRERRMEFIFENSRLIDLRRWKKLNYMDTDANPYLLMGIWVDFPTERPDYLVDSNKGKLRVQDSAGNFITYDGSNGNQMKGFFYPIENVGRLPFLNVLNVNPYLCPIGLGNIRDYANKGYKLTQTPGWPSDEF